MISDETPAVIELKGYLHKLIFSCFNPERETQTAFMELQQSASPTALLDIEDIRAINRWTAGIIHAHENNLLLED